MNETTLPLPLPLGDTQGRTPSARSAWAPTQPSALQANQTRLTPAQPGWLGRKPGQLSLPRALVLATAAHVLLVLLVGTQPGAGLGGGGRPAGTLAAQDIVIRLQGPPTTQAAMPAVGPTIASTPSSQGDRATGSAARQRPALPAVDRRAKVSAPDLGPAPQPQAGLAPQGAVLRGLETGLPAAPSLADLQPPPVPQLETPLLPPVVAVPAPKSPALAAPPRMPTPVLTAQPKATNNLQDARPQQQPALAEAERATLPRTEELTQGAPDAARKSIAAPAQANRSAAPEAPSTSPLAGKISPPSPVEPLAPVPAPQPPQVPAALQNLPPQTRVQARELPQQAPVTLPSPPAAVAPASEPAAPRVLGQQPNAVAERLPTALPTPPVPDLASMPATAAPAALARVPASDVGAQLPAAAPASLPNVPNPPNAPNAPNGLPAAAAAAPAATRAPIPGAVIPGSVGPSVVPAPAGLDAGLRGIVNVPPPPAMAASAPPGKLNLELPRTGALPPVQANQRLDPLRLNPPPADPRSKLSRDIEKAGKADCRNAHGDKGLLAGPALILDALNKDGGCKW